MLVHRYTTDLHCGPRSPLLDAAPDMVFNLPMSRVMLIEDGLMIAMADAMLIW